MIREFNIEKQPYFTTAYQKKMIKECFDKRDDMEFITFLKSDKKHITALIKINEEEKHVSALIRINGEDKGGEINDRY